MLKRRFMHSLVAIALFVAMICQGTGVLAGTTGGLSGTVLDDKNAPVVGASVTAASPTGLASTTTDANGKFSFLALSPDTYVVSVEKEGLRIHLGCRRHGLRRRRRPAANRGAPRTPGARHGHDPRRIRADQARHRR